MNMYECVCVFGVVFYCMKMAGNRYIVKILSIGEVGKEKS